MQSGINMTVVTTLPSLSFCPQAARGRERFMFLSFGVKKLQSSKKKNKKKTMLWCTFGFGVFMVTCKRRSLRSCSLWFGEMERRTFNRVSGAAMPLWITEYIHSHDECFMLYSRVLESNQLVSVAWPFKRKKTIMSSCYRRMWVIYWFLYCQNGLDYNFR